MKSLRACLVCFLGMSFLLGVMYPLSVTGMAHLFFPKQAQGGLVYNTKQQVIGSALIGQPFDKPEYFWGRLSATQPHPYNAMASSGSNFGPLHPDLIAAVEKRVSALHESDPENKNPIPVDLVTASASGLDPHISPAAAAYQINRVAKARNLPQEKVQLLVDQYTQTRTGGILGEPRVHVLLLNAALDGINQIYVQESH